MKKGYLLTVIIIILMAGFFNSCSKDEDEVLTLGEINANKIQSIIDEEHPSIVSVYEFQWDDINEEYNWEHIIGTSDYELDGIFIRVGIYYYNLESLYRFNLNGSTLELYIEPFCCILI